MPRPDRSAGAHGELVVRYDDGSTAERQVDGDTCESVVRALALMSALVLDAPSRDATTAKAPSTTESAADRAARDDAKAAADAAKAKVATFRISTGVGGAASFGIAPSAVPEGSLFVELAGAPSPRLWSPSLRATFEYANSGRTNVTGGAIQLVHAVGALDACPVHWTAGSFTASPCLYLEGGAVAASGDGVTPEASATRPWLALGAVGNLRYTLVHGLFLELRGGPRAPLVRDRFYFASDSSVTLFRAPPISGFAGGTAGVTFP
jgi:hypothetical protein